jgi:Cft2 family RNA processing exonuclease
MPHFIKEFIDAGNKVTHAKLINEVDRVDAKADQIIKHQEWQNGKLRKHSESIIELEKKDLSFEHYQQTCPANKLASKLTKTKTWVLFGVVLVIVYVILATLYHEVGIGEMMRLLFYRI